MHYFLLKRGATARRSCGTLGPAPFLLHKPFPLLAISPALWRRQRIIPILMLVFSRASTWNYRKHPSPIDTSPNPAIQRPKFHSIHSAQISTDLIIFRRRSRRYTLERQELTKKKKKNGISRPRICVPHVISATTASKHASL